MNRARKIVCLTAITAAAALATQAEHTRRWKQSTYEDFLKGTTHGVAVRSDGRLELAPKFKQIADADASYLWAIRLDASGTPYAAGGSPAKVIRLDANGKASTVFQSTDLSAQTIAFDAKGTLYVGTSPDGKVYKVSSSGEKSVFFEPKTKYVWDLAFAPDGTLYVATGDKGQIFAVAPDGKSELFYSSDEAHIRVLAFDAQANLIAGTEPSGRILRLTRKSAKPAANEAAADGFVLYETPKREVTALTVGSDGTIYAAAIGERPHNATTSAAAAAATQGMTITNTGNVTVVGTTPAMAQATAQAFGFIPQVSGGIYKIASNGAPEELWTSREDVVYALGIGQDGRLLAGTGNSGALLAIDGRGVFAQLAKAGSSQITGIARNSAGRIFLCTANPGKLVGLGPEYEPEGTYESRSFDAQLFSQWGRIEWWSPPVTLNAKSVSSDQPRLEFYVRTGNTEDPGKEWSRWFGPYTKPGAPIEAPSARFVQWKAVIHDGRPGDGIDWVSVAYLPRNVAPIIDGIALEEPGIKVQGVQLGSQPQPVNLKMPPAPGISGVIQSQSISTTSAKFDPPPQGFSQKGFQSVLWSAHDENDDDLRYAVYFRGEGEKEWKLLKENLDQRFYSFDTTSFADGAYYLKIVASDAASNDALRALTTEKESERFEVDNTPPVIENLRAGPPSGKMSGGIPFGFTVRDSATAIEKAEYSVDGGEWKLLAPESDISDSPVEYYHSGLPALAPGEHTVAVRAYDHFQNVGSAKITLQVPPAK
jgi:sugar lactone lactonase YvrE